MLDFLQQPLLNGAGDVVFRGLVYDPESEISTLQSVLLADGGGLRLVARSLDPAPGTVPAAPFVSFGIPSIDDAGRVVFEARLDTESPGVDTTNDVGIWRTDDGGNLELLAREGDAAPGLPGEVFADFEPPALGPAGHVVFRDVSGRGIWGATPGEAPEPLVLAGDAAPGGGAFTQLGFVSRVNLAGDFAFYGVTDRAVAGAWSRAASGLVASCLRLGSAPGIPGSSIFFVDSLDVNEAGDVAIGVDLFPSLLGPWIAPAGYVFEADSGLRLVATAGMEIPGEGGAAFDAAGFYPLLDDAGRVSLFGTALVGSGDVTEETDEAIWRIGAAGSLEELAREGNPAPGSSLVYRILDTPAIDGGGDVAYVAQAEPLSGGPPTRILVRALAGEAPEAMLQEGDVVAVGPGDLRSVQRVERLIAYQEKRRDALMNAHGDVALVVDLDGARAAVVVPEPAGALLLAAGALALGATKGRRTLRRQ